MVIWEAVVLYGAILVWGVGHLPSLVIVLSSALVWPAEPVL